MVCIFTCAPFHLYASSILQQIGYTLPGNLLFTYCDKCMVPCDSDLKIVIHLRIVINLHYAAFYLGLPCLQKYPFWGFPEYEGLKRLSVGDTSGG